MKKHILTLVLSIGLMTGFSNPYGAGYSDLSLTVHNGAAFTVVLDNQHYTNVTTQFDVAGIVPGHHWMKVIKYNILPCGTRGRGFVVYNGAIDVPYGSTVVANICGRNRYNQARVTRIRYAPPRVVRPVRVINQGHGHRHGNGHGRVRGHGNGHRNGRVAPNRPNRGTQQRPVVRGQRGAKIS